MTFYGLSLQAAYDIDQQTETSEVRFSFSGFHHNTEEIQYEAGLGSTEDNDDIVAFYDIGTEEGTRTLSVALDTYQVGYQKKFCAMNALRTMQCIERN